MVAHCTMQVWQKDGKRKRGKKKGRGRGEKGKGDRDVNREARR